MKKTGIPKNIFKKYPGKRVALVEGKVVAVSSDAAIAYNTAQKNILIKKLVSFQFLVKRISTFWYDLFLY